MGGKERNPLCEAANCMEEENKINWFLCLCSASRNIFSLHPSGRTFGSYNSSCWCYDVQFCMSLNAAEPPLRSVSQEHSKNSLLSLLWLQCSRLAWSCPPHPPQRLFMWSEQRNMAKNSGLVQRKLERAEQHRSANTVWHPHHVSSSPSLPISMHLTEGARKVTLQ